MYDIPLYPGYKLSEDFKILGKQGNLLAICNANPHKYCNVYVNKQTEILYLHKAIALVHVPGYFEGAWVDHIDDDPHNNDPSNLRWVTPRNNQFRVKQRKQKKKQPYRARARKKDEILRLKRLILHYEIRLLKLRQDLENL